MGRPAFVFAKFETVLAKIHALSPVFVVES